MSLEDWPLFLLSSLRSPPPPPPNLLLLLLISWALFLGPVHLLGMGFFKREVWFSGLLGLRSVMIISSAIKDGGLWVIKFKSIEWSCMKAGRDQTARPLCHLRVSKVTVFRRTLLIWTTIEVLGFSILWIQSRDLRSVLTHLVLVIDKVIEGSGAATFPIRLSISSCCLKLHSACGIRIRTWKCQLLEMLVMLLKSSKRFSTRKLLLSHKLREVPHHAF